MKKSLTKNLILCALFAALTAVFSQIVVPIGPVPINLATLAVFIAGGLLGAKYGTISQVVFVMLGLIGAPVFAGFHGGIGAVFGKTGGYILGYILAAFLVGIISQKAKLTQKILLPIAMLVGLLACYILGTAWFMLVTGLGLWTSLVYCVFPFIFGDILKIALATFLVLRLKKVLKNI